MTNQRLLVGTILAALAGLNAPCSAASYTWDFAANASCAAVPSVPVSLCNSDYHAAVLTFQDTTNTYSIVARGYDLGAGTSPTSLVVGTTTWTIAPIAPSNNLWAKFNGNNLGDDETGLGITNPNLGSVHEIERNNFIQLDLTGLPLDAQSVDLLISSLQSGETATVWGSSTVGQPGLLLASYVGPGSGGADVTTFHYDLSAGRYLTVSTNPNFPAPNDVLIQSGFEAAIPFPTTTTTTTSSSSTSTSSTTSSSSTSTSSSTSSSSSTSTSSSSTSTSSTTSSSSTSTSSSTSSSSSTSTSSSSTSTSSTTSSSSTSTSSSTSSSSSTSTSSSTSSTSSSTTSSSSTSSSTSTSSTSSSSTSTSTSSTTSTTIPFDHFQCYELKPATTSPATVSVEDRLETVNATLRFPHRLCAPVDKNGEGIIDPVQHLTGYVLKRPTFKSTQVQTVTNQFGTLLLRLTRPDVLMVPSSKSLTGPPAPLTPPIIDHFQCYKAKRARGAAKFAKRTVTIADQFESTTVTVTRPQALCVPANKNGEDPTAPSHSVNLLCFTTTGSSFGTVDAQILNQFGLDDVTLIHRRELCLPSAVQ